ncbi:MAG: phosphopentomutase [Bacillota bacterium]
MLDQRIVDRVIIVVLDSLGIGALPDAAAYGDEGSNTLGNIARVLGGLSLPNLGALGIGNLTEVLGVPPQPPVGACARAAFRSPGKDTTTGHWEMCGVTLDKPFRTYPKGFPARIITAFEAKIRRGVLGNRAASGTQIIEELGEEHLRTGMPIVYTSADSVFQIACHEDVVPLPTLYLWCQMAREILVGNDLVARVIARPFTGKPGAFVRTENRRDFSLPPVRPTLLDYAKADGVAVTAIGKIQDVFAGQGITRAVQAKGNVAGIREIVSAIEAGRDKPPGSGRELVMANLVDFDTLYGHRNDPGRYARALEEFDAALQTILGALDPRDLLVIAGDHGCDPTTPSTDHSREYVPMLLAGDTVKPGTVLGDLQTAADLGATVAEALGVPYYGDGASFAGKAFRPRGGRPSGR